MLMKLNWENKSILFFDKISCYVFCRTNSVAIDSWLNCDMDEPKDVKIFLFPEDEDEVIQRKMCDLLKRQLKKVKSLANDFEYCWIFFFIFFCCLPFFSTHYRRTGFQQWKELRKNTNVAELKFSSINLSGGCVKCPLRALIEGQLSAQVGGEKTEKCLLTWRV